MKRGWIAIAASVVLPAATLTACMRPPGSNLPKVGSLDYYEDPNEAARFVRKSAAPKSPGSRGALEESQRDDVSSASGGAVIPAVRTFDFDVIDAEYSAPFQRVVAVSAGPSVLRLIDPTSLGSEQVALGKVPTAVSVSPDGRYAAVGHDKAVSYVDLGAQKVVKEVAITTDALDVTLAGNGYVYAFPRLDQWERIHAVDLQSGLETLHTGEEIFAGTLARLHPDGKSIYGASNGLSPSDIEKYDISAGTPAYKYDSPYHGDYPMCGDLWFWPDGSRIFTRCGAVFHASSDPASDMTYAGSLKGLGRIQSLACSLPAGRIAAAPSVSNVQQPTAAESTLSLFDPQFNLLASRTLPTFADARGKTVPGSGKFIFFGKDGTLIHVIAQAITTTPGSREYALANYGAADLE